MQHLANALFSKVPTIHSASLTEAKLNVRHLYRHFIRAVPRVVREYELNVTVPEGRAVVAQHFRDNAHVKDAKMIDLLVFKGRQDLRETLMHWNQATHIMRFFPRSKSKPSSFLERFYAGH